jgi:hypothetical protein
MRRALGTLSARFALVGAQARIPGLKIRTRKMHITQKTAKLVFLAFIATFTFLIAGCAKSPEEKIIGKWQELGESANIVEFFSDGTFSIELKEGEIGNLDSLNGVWVILSDKRIKLDVTVAGVTHVTVGELSFDGDDIMIIKDSESASRHVRLE